MEKLKRVNGKLVWTKELVDMWHRFKAVRALAAKKGSATCDPKKSLIVTMDASYSCWSLKLSQC